MSDEWNKRVWPWIVAAIIGLPILYVASFGPACWITSRLECEASALPIIYRSVLWAMSKNARISNTLDAYATAGASRGWMWLDWGDGLNWSEQPVWLSPRYMITSDRKHSTAGFWITVALVAVMVGYFSRCYRCPSNSFSASPKDSGRTD